MNSRTKQLIVLGIIMLMAASVGISYFVIQNQRQIPPTYFLNMINPSLNPYVDAKDWQSGINVDVYNLPIILNYSNAKNVSSFYLKTNDSFRIIMELGGYIELKKLNISLNDVLSSYLTTGPYWKIQMFNYSSNSYEDILNNVGGEVNYTISNTNFIQNNEIKWKIVNNLLITGTIDYSNILVKEKFQIAEQYKYENYVLWHKISSNAPAGVYHIMNPSDWRYHNCSNANLLVGELFYEGSTHITVVNATSSPWYIMFKSDPQYLSGNQHALHSNYLIDSYRGSKTSNTDGSFQWRTLTTALLTKTMSVIEAWWGSWSSWSDQNPDLCTTPFTQTEYINIYSADNSYNEYSRSGWWDDSVVGNRYKFNLTDYNTGEKFVTQLTLNWRGCAWQTYSGSQMLRFKNSSGWFTYHTLPASQNLATYSGSFSPSIIMDNAVWFGAIAYDVGLAWTTTTVTMRVDWVRLQVNYNWTSFDYLTVMVPLTDSSIYNKIILWDLSCPNGTKQLDVYAGNGDSYTNISRITVTSTPQTFVLSNTLSQTDRIRLRTVDTASQNNLVFNLSGIGLAKETPYNAYNLNYHGDSSSGSLSQIFASGTVTYDCGYPNIYAQTSKTVTLKLYENNIYKMGITASGTFNISFTYTHIQANYGLKSEGYLCSPIWKNYTVHKVEYDSRSIKIAGTSTNANESNLLYGQPYDILISGKWNGGGTVANLKFRIVCEGNDYTVWNKYPNAYFLEARVYTITIYPLYTNASEYTFAIAGSSIQFNVTAKKPTYSFKIFVGGTNTEANSSHLLYGHPYDIKILWSWNGVENITDVRCYSTFSRSNVWNKEYNVYQSWAGDGYVDYTPNMLKTSNNNHEFSVSDSAKRFNFVTYAPTYSYKWYVAGTNTEANRIIYGTYYDLELVADWSGQEVITHRYFHINYENKYGWNRITDISFATSGNYSILVTPLKLNTTLHSFDVSDSGYVYNVTVCAVDIQIQAFYWIPSVFPPRDTISCKVQLYFNESYTTYEAEFVSRTFIYGNLNEFRTAVVFHNYSSVNVTVIHYSPLWSGYEELDFYVWKDENLVSWLFGNDIPFEIDPEFSNFSYTFEPSVINPYQDLRINFGLDVNENASHYITLAFEKCRENVVYETKYLYYYVSESTRINGSVTFSPIGYWMPSDQIRVKTIGETGNNVFNTSFNPAVENSPNVFDYFSSFENICNVFQSATLNFRLTFEGNASHIVTMLIQKIQSGNVLEQQYLYYNIKSGTKTINTSVTFSPSQQWNNGDFFLIHVYNDLMEQIFEKSEEVPLEFQPQVLSVNIDWLRNNYKPYESVSGSILLSFNSQAQQNIYVQVNTLFFVPTLNNYVSVSFGYYMLLTNGNENHSLNVSAVQPYFYVGGSLYRDYWLSQDALEIQIYNALNNPIYSKQFNISDCVLFEANKLEFEVVWDKNIFTDIEPLSGTIFYNLTIPRSTANILVEVFGDRSYYNYYVGQPSGSGRLTISIPSTILGERVETLHIRLSISEYGYSVSSTQNYSVVIVYSDLSRQLNEWIRLNNLQISVVQLQRYVFEQQIVLQYAVLFMLVGLLVALTFLLVKRSTEKYVSIPGDFWTEEYGTRRGFRFKVRSLNKRIGLYFRAPRKPIIHVREPRRRKIGVKSVRGIHVPRVRATKKPRISIKPVKRGRLVR